ncbi:MAG: DUF3365 domain-containing protein [Pseudomonadota bacterium]
MNNKISDPSGKHIRMIKKGSRTTDAATRTYKIFFMRYVILLALIWTAVVAASLFWNLSQTEKKLQDIARIEARDSILKDIIMRRWNAGHGGVYVPATGETPPNAYLKVSNRDIQLPSGDVLTLINPAYMTRQVHELTAKAHGIQGHITSLNPIRPENAPDEWEAGALKNFERGMQEDSALVDIRGVPYLRLMRPLITEQGCLKCHSEQGYKIGDIRGGISATIPMLPFYSSSKPLLRGLSTGHILLWGIGMAGLFFGIYRIGKQIDLIRKAEIAREKMVGELKTALDNIKTLKGLLPICSSCKKIRDDKGYWNQIEGYIETHSEAEFSHGICPECAKKLYPDLVIYD